MTRKHQEERKTRNCHAHLPAAPCRDTSSTRVVGSLFGGRACGCFALGVLAYQLLLLLLVPRLVGFRDLFSEWYRLSAFAVPLMASTLYFVIGLVFGNSDLRHILTACSVVCALTLLHYAFVYWLYAFFLT